MKTNQFENEKTNGSGLTVENMLEEILECTAIVTSGVIVLVLAAILG